MLSLNKTGAQKLDPDPAIFVINLQYANKKLFYKSFSAYYFFKVHLHNFSQIKSQKKESKFYLLFLLDDRRIRIHSSD
jgi:hypothetical protein